MLTVLKRYVRHLLQLSAQAILLAWQLQLKPAAPVRCSGCGWLRFLVWQPSMPKAFWPLNTVLLTLTDISAAVRCTILKKALAGNTARWQFSLR